MRVIKIDETGLFFSMFQDIQLCRLEAAARNATISPRAK
jgi:hypothetical protein